MMDLLSDGVVTRYKWIFWATMTEPVSAVSI
jgi:hypothetical protein